MNDEQTDQLTSFQTVTGLDNINLCIEILEFNEWDLEKAINQFFTGGSSSVQTVLCHSEDPVQNLPLQDRILNFDIKYEGISYPIQITHLCTVGDLKEKLHAQVGLPVDRMTLRGWKDKDDGLVQNTDQLHSMCLPKENQLRLIRKFGECADMVFEPEPCRAEELREKEFELHIKYIDNDNETNYILKYKGSKTIRQVKEDVVEITCPARLQKWQGWPPNGKESVTLAESDVCFPIHKLTVSKKFDGEVERSRPENKKPCRRGKRSTGHAMDDSLMDESGVNLIPDNMKDEVTAIEHFTKVFCQRFGVSHPVFRVTSFDDLVRDFLQCDVEQRKLVAIYLHHDCNPNINIFCSNVFCHETVVQCLLDNYVLWPWDLTRPSNRETFVQHIQKYFGEADARTLEKTHYDQLPVLLIVRHSGCKTEIVDCIPGTINLVDLTEKLCCHIEKFNNCVPFDFYDENLRKIRRQREEESNAEFAESERVDRAKDQLRKAEQLKEKEDERKRRDELKKKEQEDEEIAEIRKFLCNEPEIDLCNSEAVLTLKIKCQGGRNLERRFMKTDTVQHLLDYVMSEGYHRCRYRVITNHPKRNLKDLCPLKNLCDILSDRTVLFVEEIFPDDTALESIDL